MDLYTDELHVVRGVGRVVWCAVTIPARTPPATGAESARRVIDFLIETALQRRSSWLGLVLDARGGPSVFGPVTRAATVRLLESAEASRKPFAVLSLQGTAQFEQYSSLAASHAPHFALVTEDPQLANDWMTTHH